MIIPVWKNTGKSSHLFAKKVGEYYAHKTGNRDHAKATHTGTLDPMAEGVLVVLTAEDRLKKSHYSHWEKTYQFTILIGIETDSFDLLGLQKKIAPQLPSTDKIKKHLESILPQFLGTQTQRQPLFSSQRIAGESLFDKAKRGEYVTPQTNEVTLFSLDLLDTSTVTLDKIQTYITNKIDLVTGDFRQTEILNNWNKTIEYLAKKNIHSLPLFTLQTTVSKRTYVRSLVQSIAEKLELPATTYHIIRSQNGIYTKENCQNLIL